MIQAPPNGLKDLLKVKQTLALQLSLAQMKEFLQDRALPGCGRRPCINWDGRLEKLPEMRHCFAFTSPGARP